MLTRTSAVHAAAWKQAFDEFLRDRPGQRPFSDDDYAFHVDGRPRLDGVREFLSSRGIELPDHDVRRLGDRKNELVLRLLDEEGVEVFAGSVRYVRAVREAGLRTTGRPGGCSPRERRGRRRR